MTELLARSAGGLLAEFNAAGILAAADVHVATRLASLLDVDDPDVVLGAALAVRAPRLGHVCVDLATVARTVVSDEPVDIDALPWPAPGEWTSRVAASALSGPDRPFRVDAGLLYLDRYWSQECQVAADLLERARDGMLAGAGVLAPALARLFPSEPGDEGHDDQRLAAASAVLRRFAVIAGGPGTGKTTTVARVLTLLVERALELGARRPLIGLSAPTGKAAARLEEAVHDEAGRLPIAEGVRRQLLALRGLTLHRLLGWSGGSHTRFRHHRNNRLAHDVVVVDETSMVSLSQMARLVEAVRADARLILVGDPEQLASVEAGAVLGDLVGPAGTGLRMQASARELLATAAGCDVPAAEPPTSTPIGDGIVVLRRIHRFGGAIGELAAAIQSGDAAGTVSALASADNGGAVEWVPFAVGDAGPQPGAAPELEPVRSAAVTAGRTVVEAARAGAAREALTAMGAFRVLCAHRHGPAGAVAWMQRVARWLTDEVPELDDAGEWYPGRPLLVTANDYSLRLFNGDTGVVVVDGSGRMAAAFERAGEIVTVSPTRLASIDSVYAMTVHKSQGSQFAEVAVLLPDPDSPILTRELLYTAVTRARERVLVVGTEEAVRAAVERPVGRASGLRRRLWGG